VISVARASFIDPDGTDFEREIVHHPGAVVVVPMIDSRRALLVRQYRAAVDGLLLELPAGKRDVDGEPPEETARRELVEEVGMQAREWTLLARFHNSPGFSDELSHLYLARHLEPCPAAPAGIEEKHMSTVEVDLADVLGLISQAQLVDAKTIIGLSLAAARLGFDLAQLPA
jgi:8-oxo-dGTP pyrophosphatase MutT (NUDIX family)